MKVFVSHQKADSDLAASVAARLWTAHQIDCYLDLIDPALNQNGEDLADHVRKQLGTCHQLLAVVSPATKASWWVPWEIGVATEKNFPLATYAGGSAELPEYLRKWPYLRNQAELDLYARASKAAELTVIRQKTATRNDAFARASGTQEFYRTLRTSLAQVRR
jgi:hypothetical protein